MSNGTCNCLIFKETFLEYTVYGQLKKNTSHLDQYMTFNRKNEMLIMDQLL